MPVSLTQPGVYVEEIPSGVRTITGVATSIGLFIGWAARGPIDKATRLASFADYERTYGGLDQRTLLGYAVQQFFNNGGSDAYVIRLVASGTGVTAATAAQITAGGITFTAASPGVWARQYGVTVTPRQGVADRFTVQVVDSTNPKVTLEVFENLSNNTTDGRFVEAMINGRSSFITAQAGSGNPSQDTVNFTTGDDGDVLDPNSTNAALQSTFNAAVRDLFEKGKLADRLDLFNIVCVPGDSDQTTIQDLQEKCKARRALLLVDCTQTAHVDGAVAELAGLNGSEPSYAAYYFPWVLAADPLQQGAVHAFPPCGFVAGVYARTDAARGVWKAPAGTEATLTGALGFAVPMSDAENGDLNPHGVNCLRTLPVYGNVIWGARTMDGDNDRASEWKYVPVRRMALFLEESLFRGTQWVVFEPNDEPLWAQIRLNIGAFMQTLFRQGAFEGRTPREAYFVKCDGETTTQADIDLGIVNIYVGFAPLKPAEFVVIHIQQIAGELQT
jgi:phage tail sheath protein FI